MVLNYCPDDSKCLHLLPLHFRCKFVAHDQNIMEILDRHIHTQRELWASEREWHWTRTLSVLIRNIRSMVDDDCLHLFVFLGYNKNLPH